MSAIFPAHLMLFQHLRSRYSDQRAVLHRSSFLSVRDQVSHPLRRKVELYYRPMYCDIVCRPCYHFNIYVRSLIIPIYRHVTLK